MGGVLTATATIAIVVATMLGGLPFMSTAQGLLVAAELGAVLSLGLAVRKHLQPGTKQEPVAIAGAVFAVITPLVPLIAAFVGDEPKANTAKAVEVLVESIGTIIGALFVRRFVTPPTTDPAPGPADGSTPAPLATSPGSAEPGAHRS